MAEVLKVLGQSDPAATTLTDLYTVPADTAAVCSTLVICNRNSGNRSVRVSVAPGGAVDSDEQYLIYDLSIFGQSSEFYTLGITLATTDVVRVYASATGVSFNLFGTEIDG
jgi:hypothetical protein